MDQLAVECDLLASRVFPAPAPVPATPALLRDTVRLHPHQHESLAWLLSLQRSGARGGLLGDEMGLGKTLQSLAFVAANLSRDPTTKHLVVAPLTTIDNWVSEARKFLRDGVRIVRLIGPAAARTATMNSVAQDILRKTHPGGIDLLVTSFDIALAEADFLSRFAWETLVVDEGHRLKNAKAKLYGALLDLQVSFRLLLTGTPVQNNLRELHSLLKFLDPALFRVDAGVFEARIQQSGAHLVARILKPFFLRRSKSVISLPPLREILIYMPMPATQRKIYRAVVTRNAAQIGQNAAVSLNNVLMQLRKASNHPYLFPGVEPEPFVEGDHIYKSSAKLWVLARLLERLRREQRRVLIFSQMTAMLDLIQDLCAYKKFPTERLDGSVRARDRFAAISRFSQGGGGADGGEPFVFLLSTRAGGMGINLTKATVVIFYDQDWNPQADLQAQARAHRLGQTQPVDVIRLVTKESVEESILKRALRKLALARRVLESGDFGEARKANLDADDIESSPSQLRQIIQNGLEFVLGSDDDDDDGDDGTLSDEAIDRIIEQSIGKAAVIAGEGAPAVAPAAAPAPAAAAAAAAAPQRLSRTMSLMSVDDGLDIDSQRERERERERERRDAARLQRLVDQARAEQRVAAEAGASQRPLPHRAALPTREEQEAVRRQRKRQRWEQTGYKSASVELDDSDDEDPMAAGDVDVEEAVLESVVGDAARPLRFAAEPSIIANVADDSGEWPEAGFFRALSGISAAPERAYEAAKEAGDLALGDCHIVPVSEGVSVALLICVSRRNRRAGVQMDALRTCLRKLHIAASKSDASAHFPRLFSSAADSYAIERMIKRHLCAHGTRVKIYYHPRGKRVRPEADDPSTQDEDEGEDDEAEGDEDEDGDTAMDLPPAPAQSKRQRRHTVLNVGELPWLPNALARTRIALHELASDTRIWKRYIVALGGCVCSVDDASATHVVSDLEHFDAACHRASAKGARIVGSQWLKQCINKQRVCTPNQGDVVPRGPLPLRLLHILIHPPDKALERQLVAAGAKVVGNISDEVLYVVTSREHLDNTLCEFRNGFPHARIVSTAWGRACVERCEVVAPDEFRVKP